MDKAMWIALAASGQIEYYKREIPVRVIWGFCGWLIGIITCVYLVSI